MTATTETAFIYVIYIRATPQRVWQAVTQPEFMRQYWFGMHIETDWRPGSPWRLVFSDGRTADSGEVLAVEPERRLALKWRNDWKPELHAEGFCECTIELEPVGEAVRLSIAHVMPRPESQLITAVAGGWPKILSNLKSLLETGEPALTR